MADPSPFPFLDLLLNRDLPSSLPETSSDVVDITEVSIDKGLQLVGVCLCGAPCLRAVKQDRLDPDLVVMG